MAQGRLSPRHPIPARRRSEPATSWSACVPASAYDSSGLRDTRCRAAAEAGPVGTIRIMRSGLQANSARWAGGRHAPGDQGQGANGLRRGPEAGPTARIGVLRADRIRCRPWVHQSTHQLDSGSRRKIRLLLMAHAGPCCWRRFPAAHSAAQAKRERQEYSHGTDTVRVPRSRRCREQ